MTTNQNPLDAIAFDVSERNISRNFKLSEYASKCGAKRLMLHPSIIAGVQNIRDACNFPIRINSGFRTTEHNSAVGGSAGSLHTLGMAVDLSPASGKADELTRIITVARSLGFVVRPYPTFVHIDCGKIRNW
jgi:zinc D-Ala-D-Ala carboxypeptidase